MKYSDLDKVDPLLTKLRITGEKHLAPRSASKPNTTSTNNEDLVARSKQRRDYLQSSYEELKKYAVLDDPKPNDAEFSHRGTTYRTRKLWDFDSKEKTEPSILLSTRHVVENDDKVWTAQDVRREARQSVTRQVQRDLLEMEEFNQEMKRRIAHCEPVLKKDDYEKEKRDADDEIARLLESKLSKNEENTDKDVDDGYGKVMSRSKAAPRKGPYLGINSVTETNEKNEEHMFISAARLQRIRELNKQNYESRASSYPDSDLDGEVLEKKKSNDSADEIMPPPPRYLRIIKERTGEATNPAESSDGAGEIMQPPPRYDLRMVKTESHSQPEPTEISSSRPLSSPTTSNIKSKTHTRSLSPPRRPVTSSSVQLSTPSTNDKQQTMIGSPSSFYASTNADGDAASIQSALSDGTPGQGSTSSSSQSNNVAQTTLSVILGRIDDAKENFKKALLEEDLKKQAELVSLITRLGEAAVTMRKLEDS